MTILTRAICTIPFWEKAEVNEREEKHTDTPDDGCGWQNVDRSGFVGRIPNNVLFHVSLA